jgi:hypothetical protein
LRGCARLLSFLVKRGGYSIHYSRKESGHGEIVRSDEERFGVKEKENLSKGDRCLF